MKITGSVRLILLLLSLIMGSVVGYLYLAHKLYFSSVFNRTVYCDSYFIYCSFT